MENQKTLLRRLLEVGAIYALLHTMLLLGGTGYLFYSGIVDKEKLQGIGQILRGEPDEIATARPENSATLDPATDGGINADGNPPTTLTASAGPRPFSFQPTAARARQMIESQDVLYRHRLRFMDEMKQRMGLLNRLMIQLSTKQDAIRVEREASASAEKEVVEQKGDEAFQKELSIYNQMSPKLALEQLLLKDPAYAAQLLFHMDTLTSSSILSAAKTKEQKDRTKEIMELLKDVAPVGSEGP